MSFKRVLEKQKENPVWYDHILDPLDDKVLSTGKDGWSAEQWLVSYPRGIPQTNSPEYRRNMERYGDAWIYPVFGLGDEWRLIRDWESQGSV